MGNTCCGYGIGGFPTGRLGEFQNKSLIKFTPKILARYSISAWQLITLLIVPCKNLAKALALKATTQIVHPK